MSSTEHTPEDWADGKIRTRENNPMYTGPYTLADYYRELRESRGRFSGLSKEGYEFAIRCLQELTEEDDGPEPERYRRIVREALSRYDGPRKWGHGFGIGWEPSETAGRRMYYTLFYELTDEESIDVVLSTITDEADRWTLLESIYDDVLKALNNDPEWTTDELEIARIYNQGNGPDGKPYKPDIEKYTENACKGIGWRYLIEKEALTLCTPDIDEQERRRIAIEKIVSETLDEHKKDLEAAREYEKTGKLRDEFRLFDAVLRTTGKAPKIGETGEILIGAPDLNPETSNPNVNGYIWEINPSRFSDNMPLPINSFMWSAWKNLAGQQRFNDDGTLEIDKLKEILLESKKNNNDLEWLKANIMTKGHEPPSFAEIGFVEQIGDEMETAIKEGRPLIFTEAQLCKCRYGIPPQNRVNDATCKKFGERFDELCNMKVLIPSRGGLSISPEAKDERGEKLRIIVGEEVRLMDPRIEYRWTGKKQDKAVKVYIFEDDRAPIHCINAWHGKIARPRRDLLQTDPIPADELSPKGRAHYDAEGLQRNKRKLDHLSMDPIIYSDLKYCILHSIAYAYGFTQKGNDRLILNLEDAYKVIYKAPAPEKRSYKWKDYVKAVYTYLTFLIEKGAIEDYHPGKEFKKDSGIVFIDVDRGKNLLYPPQ